MRKETIKTLLDADYVDQLRDIFKVYHYHRTKLCKGSGIGYCRLNTIVESPFKATIQEVELLAEYFQVDIQQILLLMDRQRLRT